jgi:tetratricopeptide (TPR) repeat protein
VQRALKNLWGDGRDWLPVNAQSMRSWGNLFTWQGTTSAFSSFLNGVSRVGWILFGVAIVVLLLRSVSADFVSIEPISVPKIFAENGYTPDVASQRLRDALNSFAKNTGSSMQSPSLAVTSEFPKITVPKVDVSLDTAAALIRNVFHIGSSRDISGEFVLQDNLVWLRVRLNGREVFASQNGVTPSKLDDLFATAAPYIVQEVQPYLIATSLYKEGNPEKAIEIAENIISRFPESDINFQWSLVVKAKYFLDLPEPKGAEAEALLRRVIDLNPRHEAAHYNLGVALGLRAHGSNVHAADNYNSQAAEEYTRAIEIKPDDPLAHNNLGVALERLHKPDAAIAQYRLAIAFFPSYAVAYNNWGNVLKDQTKIDEAIMKYRRALDIDPNYAAAHYNLGNALHDLKRLPDSVTEYRRAISIDSRSVNAHISLANALREQKQTDEALEEYRRALEIDPSNKIAKISIERITAEAISNNLMQSNDNR